MSGTELLPTIAEVSVAFAGFASLVTVLGQRHSGGDFEVNAVRLRGMLQASLITVIFSLVPFLPRELGLSEPASWRLAATVFAAVGLARIVILLRAGVRQGNALLVGTVVLAQAVAIVLLAAVAAGVISERASGVYLCALLIYLCVAAFLFLRLVLSLMVSQRPAV